MRSASLGCAVLLLSAGAAQAADNGFYLGGGITRTSIDTSFEFVEDAPDFSLDDDDNGWKIIAGFRPLDWMAIEVNYVDFGSVTSGDAALGGEYELTGFDAFAVRSEEHTSELQSRENLVCRLLLEKKKEIQKRR